MMPRTFRKIPCFVATHSPDPFTKDYSLRFACMDLHYTFDGVGGLSFDKDDKGSEDLGLH